MTHGNFRTTLESIARNKSSLLHVFTDFCRMSACAVSVLAREHEYIDTASRYTSAELSEISHAFADLVSEMERTPFADLLGAYYLGISSSSSKQARGEFFTPPALSKLMARMAIDPEVRIAEGRPISVGEPACGSGGMVLAVAELFAPTSVDLLRVTCQDISPLAADMCFINTTLWGIPAQVILGDTIRGTETARWKNPHWRRVGEDQRLALLQVQELLAHPSQQQSNPQVSACTARASEVRDQFQLDLGGF